MYVRVVYWLVTLVIVEHVYSYVLLPSANNNPVSTSLTWSYS